MYNFSEYIKLKIQNYEMPYDETGWLRIQKTLKINKIKRIAKYAGIATSVILFPFIIFYNNHNDSKITKNQQLKTEVSKHTDNKIITNIPFTYIVENNEDKINNTDQLIIKDSTIYYTDYQIDSLIPVNIFDNNVEKVILVENLEDIEYTNFEKGDTLLPNQDSLIVDTTAIIIPKPTYYFPTAFSPNGDGVNDEFFIVGVDLQNMNFQLLIYDRWGNEVFETMNPDYKWNGGNCKQGIYIWVFRYQDIDGIIHSDKGQVTLIK